MAKKKVYSKMLISDCKKYLKQEDVMANMSYCRFENTLNDLKDCAESLDDNLSGTEERARERLVKVCRDIIDDWDSMNQAEKEKPADD